MSIHLHSDLTQLQFLSERLGQSNATNRSQLIERITKKVKDLQQDSQIVYSPMHEKVKSELDQVLTKLANQLAPVGTKSSEDLRSLITKIKDNLESSPIAASKKPAVVPSNVGLNIAFFSNLDSPDTNGAIIGNMIDAIETGFPFITSRSMLNALEMEDSFKQDAIRRRVLEKAVDWDVYMQQDDETGEGYVVFLPKSLQPGKTPMEKLALLDFATDGSIVPVSVEEALKGSNKRNSIESFTKLFKREGKVGKIFYLDGHGSPNMVAGIAGEKYKKLREFFDHQNVKAVLISSCYSGGESSLYSLDDSEPKAMGYDSHFTHANYPTIARSVGDFVSWAGATDPFINIKSFLEKLPTLLEGPHSYTAIAEAIDEIELSDFGSEVKSLANVSAVHFPASPGVPQGFRTVEEQAGVHEKLTFQKVRSGMAETQKKIVLKSPQSLQLYPQVISVPVEIAYTHPILLSSSPGKSRHFLHSLTLQSGTSLDEWIKKTDEFAKKNSLGVSKSFFMETLRVGDKTYEQVVILQSLGSIQYVYKDGDVYWMKRGDEHYPISPLAHKLFANVAQSITEPSKKAATVATAGQEGEKDFQEALQNSSFALGKMTPSRLRWLFESGQLSQQDKVEIVAYLMRSNEQEMALELIKEGALAAGKDIYGAPLLTLAAANKHKKIVAYLLEQGVDPNEQDAGKRTALNFACRNRDKEIIDMLLSVPEIDVNRVNDNDFPPFLSFLFKEDFALFDLLKEKINVNLLIKKRPLIEHLIAAKAPLKSIQAVLDLNPNLTLGEKSPLIWAQNTRRIEVVKALLDKKADPFLADQQGNIPFIEAIHKGMENVLELYLSHPLSDLTITDKKGMTPYLAALKNGNQKVLEMLRARGAGLPKPFKETDKNILVNLLRSAAITPDIKMIEVLLRLPELQYWVGEALLENKQDAYLLQLLKEEKVSPNAFSEPGKTLFNAICDSHSPHGNRVLTEHIEESLKKGADVNQSPADTPGVNTFASAFFARKFDLARMVLPFTDLTKTADLKDLMAQAIYEDELELVQELKNKAGLSIDPDVGSKIPLLLKDGKEGKVFQWLVNEGLIDINKWIALDDGESNPFIEVIKSGNKTLFDFCLSKGAVTTVEEGKKISPLYAAAASRNSKGYFVTELLKRGSDLRASIKDYQNTFAVIVHRQSLETIKTVLETDPEIIKTKNSSNKITPLHAAAVRTDDDRIPLFKFLMEKGADINELSLDGKTCTRPFFRTGSLDIIKHCFENGLELNEDNQKDVMALAVASGNGELVQLLADKKYPVPPEIKVSQGYDKSDNGTLYLTTLTKVGVDLKKLSEEERKELIQSILYKKDYEALKYFYSVCGFSDVEVHGLQHFAITTGLPQIVKLLQSLNVRLPALDDELKRSLIAQNKPDLLEFYLDNGLDSTTKVDGKTLCEIAFDAYSPKGKCIELLVKRGAALPAAVGEEKFPLIYVAVRGKDVALIKFLLEKGIGDDLYKMNDKMSETAAVLARRGKDKEILRLLFGKK